MSYVLVISNTVQSEGGLPASARRLDNQAWVLGLPVATVGLQQACGYYLVVDVTQPTDPTFAYDRSITLPGGVPTVTWTQRAKTPAEVAADTANTNQTTLRANPQTDIIDVLIAAIAALQVVRDTPNATINGAPASYLKDVAQNAQTIARRVVRLARLDLGVLDSTAGTT